jgi:hypothetical protein
MLAPYRDLVRFVSPTPEERQFLKRTDEAFVSAQHALTESERFRRWLYGALFETQPGSFAQAWAAAVAADALFAFSGLRVLLTLTARPRACGQGHCGWRGRL